MQDLFAIEVNLRNNYTTKIKFSYNVIIAFLSNNKNIKIHRLNFLNLFENTYEINISYIA